MLLVEKLSPRLGAAPHRGDLVFFQVGVVSVVVLRGVRVRVVSVVHVAHAHAHAHACVCVVQ